MGEDTCHLLARRTLEVYRDPVNGVYQTRLILHAGDTVSPISRPGVSLNVLDLLP